MISSTVTRRGSYQKLVTLAKNLVTKFILQNHSSDLSDLTYMVCSKSIEPYFFPCKPMKRGRLPSVEMWRGHSCAVVNFFPPAESVSRWQSAYE
jgi:hypothetical protein